jgi:hypothetical protein
MIGDQTRIYSTCVESPFRFSPFYAILYDGQDRMFELVKSDKFTFVINNTEFESTIAEAVLISPLVLNVCDQISRAVHLI